mmetsp:Transcript_23152/g.64380  ORF Transcript_23152/g.64380 Transcript_23152/m.64380 type:complete len:235 (-) Transcript_23152:144-848(-)|eukprot:CAMPEP_0168758224 /NCGR_PEP_ID=MMETSP0724-20121128/21589_1 /TAXON_ID=265536 /ORGANISM="Amphiprora sp., Strain CCMP467" /LENGTH=234 /DNA_ID=CAMNT_0008807093 /DNA_START=65 /DNA_END=769 /DNA_ORIENTATION=-
MTAHHSTVVSLTFIGSLATQAVLATTPLYLPVMEQRHSPNLETCSQAVEVAKDIMGTGFDCNSISSSYNCTVVCQGETACCGDVCGANEQTIMDFDINPGFLEAKDELTCIIYSSGEDLIQICTSMEYCNGQFCGCETSLGSTKCNSCELCEFATSGNDIPLIANDCKNVEGGDFFSQKCSEANSIDTINNLLEEGLDCPETSSAPAAFVVLLRTATSSMVAVTLMVAMKAFLL